MKRVLKRHTGRIPTYKRCIRRHIGRHIHRVYLRREGGIYTGCTSQELGRRIYHRVYLSGRLRRRIYHRSVPLRVYKGGTYRGIHIGRYTSGCATVVYIP